MAFCIATLSIFSRYLAAIIMPSKPSDLLISFDFLQKSGGSISHAQRAEFLNCPTTWTHRQKERDNFHKLFANNLPLTSKNLFPILCPCYTIPFDRRSRSVPLDAYINVHK